MCYGLPIALSCVLLHLELQCVSLWEIHTFGCIVTNYSDNYFNGSLISIVHYGDDVDGNYDIDSHSDGRGNDNDFHSEDDDVDDNFRKAAVFCDD